MKQWSGRPSKSCGWLHASLNEADGFDELIGRPPDGEDVEDMSAVRLIMRGQSGTHHYRRRLSKKSVSNNIPQRCTSDVSRSNTYVNDLRVLADRVNEGSPPPQEIVPAPASMTRIKNSSCWAGVGMQYV